VYGNREVNGGNVANGAACTVMKDAVRKIAPKTEAIETQICQDLDRALDMRIGRESHGRNLIF
jgi:hypothetical protein